MRAILRCAAALLAVALLPACTADGGGAGRRTRGELTMATGTKSGVYDQYGTEYTRLLRAELPGLTVRTIATAGSFDNLERLGDGRAQLGFATADTAYLALAPGPASTPSSGPAPTFTPVPATRLRAVARVYDEYIHVVVPQDSRARTLQDLKGLRVSTGPRGSSTELVADRLLHAVGLDAERDTLRTRVGLDPSAEMLRAGKIDALFWSGGLPTPSITKLSGDRPIRLLPLADQVNALRAAYGTFYRRAIVPATAYGLGQTVTIGVPNYLVVSADVPEDVVYQLTRVLFERRKDLAGKVASGSLLDPRSAISTGPIALHPGAQHYYRDLKGSAAR